MVGVGYAPKRRVCQVSPLHIMLPSHTASVEGGQVHSAHLRSMVSSSPIPWAEAATGSAGTICRGFLSLSPIYFFQSFVHISMEPWMLFCTLVHSSMLIYFVASVIPDWANGNSFSWLLCPFDMLLSLCMCVCFTLFFKHLFPFWYYRRLQVYSL